MGYGAGELARSGMASHRRRGAPRRPREVVGRGTAGARHQHADGRGHPGRDRAADRADRRRGLGGGGRGGPSGYPSRRRRGGPRLTAPAPPSRDGPGTRGWCPRGRGSYRGRDGGRGSAGRRPAADGRPARVEDRPARGGSTRQSGPRRHETPEMRVLVTGATGMLGRATTTTLMSRGDEVTVLQRGRSGLDCREVRGDLADATAVRRAVLGQDAVVHLAAKVDVTGPWHEYASANIEGTRNVVAASRSEGVGRLVHVSSPSVAHSGRALMGVGADRADPARARGHYARSKATAELEALAADSGSLAVLAVRPHLVWGPGDTQLVGRIVARARAGRLPILGPGAALIDTTYVDNAVDALVAALHADDSACGAAYVVTNGEPRPVVELLAAICTASGVPVPRRHVPAAVARAAGGLLDAAWARLPLPGEPPLTRFTAEQLSTAHWFDQRRTRE